MRTKGQAARDAHNASEYLHCLRPQEGSGDNKGLNEKLDSEDKEKNKDALKNGLSWLDSNPGICRGIQFLRMHWAFIFLFTSAQ